MTANNLYTRETDEIVVYSVDWCPDCRRAKFFFKRNNISVIEVNIDTDKTGESFVREINSGFRIVPTIILPDGSIMVEPSTEDLNKKFSKS